MRQDSKVREILLGIINAHCMNHNIDKVIKLSGISRNIFYVNRKGKLPMYIGRDRAINILLRIITEEKGKEIINSMGYPFIQISNYHYEKEKDSWYWIENVLSESKSILSQITGCGIKSTAQ